MLDKYKILLCAYPLLMHLSTYQEQALSYEKNLKLVAQEQIVKLQVLVETLQAELRRLKNFH